MGELAVQSDPANAIGGGTLVVERSRHLVESPDGRWFIVYHAYENGFYTLGRQTLLEPIEWTSDGWFRIVVGTDAAMPIRKPAGTVVPHGRRSSDDFSRESHGRLWSFYKGTDTDRDRYRHENGALVLKAKGAGPADSSPLSFVTGDHAYEISVDIERDRGTSAGLLLFYSSRLYAGLGFSDTNTLMHSYGLDRLQGKLEGRRATASVRIRNDRHIVSIHYSVDGQTWTKYDRVMEVVGLPPQRGVRVPEPAPGDLCGWNGRGQVSELHIQGATVARTSSDLSIQIQPRTR